MRWLSGLIDEPLILHPEELVDDGGDCWPVGLVEERQVASGHLGDREAAEQLGAEAERLVLHPFLA